MTSSANILSKLNAQQVLLLRLDLKSPLNIQNSAYWAGLHSWLSQSLIKLIKR